MAEEIQKIECGIYTMCLIQDEDKVLLINRPDKKGFPGYLGPGGKVDMPETILEGTVREVFEETGLVIQPEDLIFKGIDGYVVPETNYRYMVFNYIAKKYEGQLLENSPEGEPKWVSIEEALTLPMQSWFKQRFPLFFEPGTFERTVVWDETNKVALEEKIYKLD